MNYEKTGELKLPRRNGTYQKKKLPLPKHKLRMEYRNGHKFHIHSVSASSDGEHFISGDEVGINLWSINSNNVGYKLLNIAPPKMVDLLEVLTHCEFHP